METRLAKRRRLETGAQQALERNIARFVGLGVPPGVVRRVLPMARLLRSVLPLPDDMVDQIALHYLWLICRPIRQLWGYLNPVGGTRTTTEMDNVWDAGTQADIRQQTAMRRLYVRGPMPTDSAMMFVEGGGAPMVTYGALISYAFFVTDALGSVYTRPWRAVNQWFHILQAPPGSNPFFPGVYPPPDGPL